MRLNRIISLLLALVTVFTLVGCGEGSYQNGPGTGVVGGGVRPDGSGGGAEQPPMNDDPSDDFVVTLLADGAPYSPRMDMSVYWSDGFSLHSAPVGEDGVARIDGLDGDYRVTLSAVPNEYTYDPNSNIATNDNRSITLNLYTLNRLSGSGTGLYDCYQFRKTGVYSAVIESPEDAIYFQYAPELSGTYSIESWADTTADNINPYVDVYGGSSQFKYYLRTTNDGGTVGSYTINFVHTVQIADEMISAGGQAVYTFAVKAESKDGKYPITVTFAVKRDGGFELPDYSGGTSGSGGTVMAVPKFDFSGFDPSAHEYGSEYSIVYPERPFNGSSSTYVFDESYYRLWKIEDGGDGFYHVYDEEKYAQTNGYGPILYANITTKIRFLDRAFTEIEYSNPNVDALETMNAALTISGVNYKHFIEGYTVLSTFGKINGSTYYCTAECPCHNAAESIENWACTTECTSCTKDCRRCPEELIGNEGYQQYANSDGMVPVTEELKEFLKSFALKQKYFWDGKGYLDSMSWGGRYFQSGTASIWLFACAYYE